MSSSERAHRIRKAIMSADPDTPSAAQPTYNPEGPPSSGGSSLPPWQELGRMLLAERDEARAWRQKMDSKMERLALQYATMKGQSVILGAIAGLIFGGLVSGVMAVLVAYVKGGK